MFHMNGPFCKSAVYLMIHLLHFTFQKSVNNAKIGFGKAKASGWVELTKTADGSQKVVRKVGLPII